MKDQGYKYKTEAKLARDCARGKAKAQAALYEKYARKMFGVVLRYSPDRETAEDLLQDGFVKVFQSIERYRGDGSLEGWVRRIIVNTALEYHRKKVRFFPVVDIEQAADTDSGHDLLAKMGADEILHLVQELPQGYRTVFNLYAIEGYSHKEIAEELKISVGTSKSQLARARDMLKTNLHTLMEDSYGQVR